ncbi:MAG: HD domain-containing protein, partial [bacterium]
MPIIFRDNFERLIKKTSQYLYVEDLDLIRRAYEFTESSMRQRGVIRFSGDPAIVHAMEVASKLADWQLDASTIAAGVLHDVIEDPEIHHMQIRATFKEQVALLVEGVTKLKGYQLEAGEDEDLAYHVSMFLAAASDIRVALIKLADRLHNMRTLEYLPASRREHNCRETRELFIPLARFLGMERIQQELEDITFRFSENELYERTLQQIDQVIEQENEFFSQRIRELRSHLRKKYPFAPIKEKHHSVYETFQLFRKGRNFKKRTGYVQIVVDSVEECYQVLGEAHGLYQSSSAGFVDTIHHPDLNLKRRLRTELLDSAGNPFTVEILTREMKRINDDGIVPYFMAPQSLERTDFLAERMNEINAIFDAYQRDREDQDKRMFLEILSGDILKRDIYVITMDGRRVTLPVNST